MTLFYSGAPGGALLWSVRLVVGSTMAAAIVLGFSAIRRRDIAAHRAWMIRAYALGLGAGTQVFTQGIGEALFGTSDLSTGISVASGWLINALVAEWVIRRPSVRRARLSRAASARHIRPAATHDRMSQAWFAAGRSGRRRVCGPTSPALLATAPARRTGSS